MKFYIGAALVFVLVAVGWWVDRAGYERAMTKQKDAIIALETTLGEMREKSQAEVDKAERNAEKLRKANNELIRQAMEKDQSLRAWHDTRVPNLADDLFWMFDGPGSTVPGRPWFNKTAPVVGTTGPPDG